MRLRACLPACLDCLVHLSPSPAGQPRAPPTLQAPPLLRRRSARISSPAPCKRAPWGSCLSCGLPTNRRAESGTAPGRGAGHAAPGSPEQGATQSKRRLRRRSFEMNIAREYTALLPPATSLDPRLLVRRHTAAPPSSAPAALAFAPLFTRFGHHHRFSQAAKYTRGIRVVKLQLYSIFTLASQVNVAATEEYHVPDPLGGEPYVSATLQARRDGTAGSREEGAMLSHSRRVSAWGAQGSLVPPWQAKLAGCSNKRPPCVPAHRRPPGHDRLATQIYPQEIPAITNDVWYQERFPPGVS